MILGGIEVNLFGQFILLNSLNIRRKIWRRTITFNSTFLPKLVLLNSAKFGDEALSLTLPFCQN